MMGRMKDIHISLTENSCESGKHAPDCDCGEVCE